MYSFSSRARYSEVDEAGNLNLVSMMNYLQDCCLFHADSLGVGPDYQKSHHCLWVVTGWQIMIDQYPKMFEPIIVETIPYQFSGYLGWRNVLIRDGQGKCLVRANSSWVYLSTDTWKPVRPEKAEIDAYGTEGRIQMEYAPRKIKLPENMADSGCIPVTGYLIDTNHHVNNLKYIELGRSLIDDNFPVKELRAEYKKQAKPGDIFYPKTGRLAGWNYVSMENESGKPYFVMALK
ncbi:MAG: thioesterase [Clostridiales bacterium]|nr:thioesterase [Clostridiales bacterium]